MASQDLQQLFPELIAQRYQLVRQIGEGRWSKVYVAQDTKNRNLPISVKILKSEEMKDAEIVHRFQREVQLTQQLSHPNIVRVFSSGFTADGSLYLVSEYLPGGDLERYLRDYSETPLPFFRAFNLMRFIARGLAHAHGRKILHRDIKPENILLTHSRNIKIADFGIARSLLYASSHGDRLFGTPFYMAPEQFDKGEVGPWSDVYSLGILSYELLNGKKPFDADQLSRLVYQHCFVEPPTILFKGGKIPCWMEDIVHKACEKEPERRYQHAGELLVALETSLDRELKAHGLLGSFIYFVRPSGQICTLLTERGVPRKRLSMLLLALLGIVALACWFFFASDR